MKRNRYANWDRAAPPFGWTILLDPDIITDSDKTTFVSLSYAGQATFTMYLVNNDQLFECFKFSESWSELLERFSSVNII